MAGSGFRPVYEETDNQIFAAIAASSVQAFRKQLYHFYSLQTGVNTGQILYYSFNVGPDKDLILYNRFFTVAEGPVFLNTNEGAVFSGGTPITIINAWRGNPGPATTINLNPTITVPGTPTAPDFVPGSGRNTGSFFEAGALLILPRGASGLVTITSQATPNNIIRFAGTFAEVDLNEILG